MSDVYHGGKAFRVIAPLANRCAAIVIYNLLHPEGQTISTEVTTEDYQHASGMSQPMEDPWELPVEGMVLFDWRKRGGQKLDTPYPIELTGFSDRLLLLAPIQNGWAVIGARDKYLSPVAVKTVEASAEQLDITMVESGPLVIWCASGTPQAKGISVKALGNGFWQFDLPVGNRDGSIRITK
jgi:hypothetical protein